MTDRIEDTKDIRIQHDDDSLDRLIEHRGTDNMARNTHKTKKRHKKNSKTSLTILITALGFALVFVIFFVGAYMFFTADPGSKTATQGTQEKQDNTEVNDIYGEDEEVLQRPASVNPADDGTDLNDIDTENSDEDSDKNSDEESDEDSEDEEPAAKPQADKQQTDKTQTDKPSGSDSSKPADSEPEINSGETSEGVVLE